MLPREKKQKEDKFITLGQATFDVFPLLQGSTHHEFTAHVSSLPGSPLDHLKPDDPKPEIRISISINEPLFSETEFSQLNFMRVALGSLYSPPEQWQTPSKCYLVKRF